jgi:hypothetical protein
LSPAFGAGPKPTWWACSWLDDTLILYPRLGCLLPRLQEEARWRRGDLRDLDRPGGPTESAPQYIRGIRGWRFYGGAP